MKWIKFLIIFTVLMYAKEIRLNFKNLDINDFIKMVAKITDKNILLTQNLSGKVNFISVKPVNEKEVYDILINILKSRGYTLLEDNGFLKVVRSADAYRNAPPLASQNKITQLETDIISLKNIRAKEAYSLINYLVSRYGKIVVNRDKNLLIVTDYPKNIDIIKKILTKIDKTKSLKTKFIHFKNADIQNIFPKISAIINTSFSPDIYKYKLLKDDSTNTLIVVAPKSIIEKIESVSKKLDIKPNITNMTTDIITLKNSDAVSMEKILKKIVSQKYASSKEKPSITADKETNSLIIIATNTQIQIIKKIIKALDIPKQQVYVKARILEISNSKASQLGFKYGILGGIADSSGLYTLNVDMGGNALAFDPTALGISIPTLKHGLALGITLDMLETLGAAKKLSEPSILCINNTPSNIYVGKTVSVLTGKTTSTSTSESYTREDIGLTLKITPRIDSDSKVALNVKATIEDLLPGSPTLMPITSKRTIDTTTIVRNGQSIIIGGLVRDNKDITVKKVPLLGDIPLLGNLFRHKIINNDKTTLAIILTPYIVKRSDDLDKLRIAISKLNALEKQFAQKMIKKIKKRKKTKKPVYDIMGESYENDR